MAAQDNSLQSLLPQVVTLSRQAGAAIMAIYHSGEMGETSKADDSPLTLADMASHHTIIAGLADLTPAIPILSEEAANIPYATRRHWQRFWLVDPLDGTKEFIKRNGEFTVNIALIEKGTPILGVVYAPVLDTCYFAAQGEGAFMQRGTKEVEPIRTKRYSDAETIKVVASRSHSDARTTMLLERLGKHEAISMGSSLKFCLVAEGAAHFYPRLGPTMEWDTAAAQAVVKEAGGVVRTANGSDLIYNKEDLHNPEFFVYAALDSRLQTISGTTNNA